MVLINIELSNISTKMLTLFQNLLLFLFRILLFLDVNGRGCFHVFICFFFLYPAAAADDELLSFAFVAPNLEYFFSLVDPSCFGVVLHRDILSFLPSNSSLEFC